MSPVFRHGGLRLYLLKLLDEAPRHGYEVIRLLQDRFLGVYAPSPGTIYPRLARLEEEGLVTHDEVDGKKVYRITDKGREEIQSRLDDLAELEDQITASVRDIAREVSEDVRDTVRSLREEITWAAGQYRGAGAGRAQAREDPRERARRAREEVHESARQARDEATRARADSAGEETEADAAIPGPREWADWASAQGWQAWAGWRSRSGQPPWGGPTPREGRGPWESSGPGPWEDRGRRDERRQQRRGHRGEQRGGQGASGRGWSAPGLDAALFRDLERLAVDFANQLRRAAWTTDGFGEKALGDLRSILEDTLTRIRDEVFGGAAGEQRATDPQTPEPGADAAGTPPAPDAAGS